MLAAKTTRVCAHGPARQAVAPKPFAPAIKRVNQQRAPVICQGLFGLGLPEIAVIAGVAALIFGPSKLPELGKGLGTTVKSFQNAAKEFETELKAGMAGDKPEDKKPEGAAEEAKKELPK